MDSNCIILLVKSNISFLLIILRGSNKNIIIKKLV